LFAQFDKETPDGICLDAEGAVWVASPGTREVLRVRDGGEVTERIPLEGRRPFACMLGGADRRTLFLCTARMSFRDPTAPREAWIETVEVEVPGAGYP
jgi:sugar lactone lactonase YvrE